MSINIDLTAWCEKLWYTRTWNTVGIQSSQIKLRTKEDRRVGALAESLRAKSSWGENEYLHKIINYRD